MHIGYTSTRIVYQLKDVYAVCKRYWDVATYKWDVHNGKIDSISLVVRRTLLNVGGITRTHSVTIDKTNVLAQTVQYV
jgi:hypothetical protein